MWFIHLFGRIHSTICLRMQTAEITVVSTRSTGFRTSKTPQIVSVGCFGVYKGNVGLCECDKIREMSRYEYR